MKRNKSPPFNVKKADDKKISFADSHQHSIDRYRED